MSRRWSEVANLSLLCLDGSVTTQVNTNDDEQEERKVISAFIIR